MPEFEDKQASLGQAREQSKQTRRDLFAAQEKRNKALRLRDSLRRYAAGAQVNDRIKSLTGEIGDLSVEIRGLQASSKERILAEKNEILGFLPFSDPTVNIAKLDDVYPILLFPVRIETRFKQAEVDNLNVNQLWVRIYPDDIAVDTFEDLIAEVEVQNAHVYWTNIWKAGGDEGENRAAWQSLVRSHGAGRAYWIIKKIVPQNLNDLPNKALGEVLLVVVTENPLPAAEKAEVVRYWTDVWLAKRNNDQAAIDAALATLALAITQERANIINADYVPQNLNIRPNDESAATVVRVEFLELPAADLEETQEQPWGRAANTAILPERFVLLGYNGDKETLREIGNSIPSELVIGPNPAADPEDQIQIEDDELKIPSEIKWMVDFDEAIEKGMGFRVSLSDAQAAIGFDRLFVLGVRLSADIGQSKTQLQTLIAHHQNSRKGFSILRQGAPTNNVEDFESGYTWRSDSDASFDHFFKQDHTNDPSDWRTKKDGLWLAESLGIDADLLKTSPDYFATDQCEARAMNIALWPSTIGSFMEQQLSSVFSETTIQKTREFFDRYVVGRGTIPAIRVGNQPYGILAATPFSRMQWLKDELLEDDNLPVHIFHQATFLPMLYGLILKVAGTWNDLAKQVSYVGKPNGDPHQMLLDVVGLHPSSVEFHQRYAATLEQLYNLFKYTDDEWYQYVDLMKNINSWYKALDILRESGYDEMKSGYPDLLSKHFFKSANLLKGPVIDDRPLSETDLIRPYRADGANYLEWLVTSARTSHATLRLQSGFLENRPPTALLYLMLHRALDQGYLDTSFDLHMAHNLFTQDQVAKSRKKPKFIHIQDADEDEGSQWQYLYKAEPVITGDPGMTIADFIPQVLAGSDHYLEEQINAIEHLQRVPTSRLERAFVEHMDCGTYRLDAWWLGLVNLHLDLMRTFQLQKPDAKTGCYLGAFGWLEHVHREEKAFESVVLNEKLSAIFQKEDQPTLTSDSSNFGYIHAPSLRHAATAAVLRNGYLSNATEQNSHTLSINLTSERVRVAMEVIEGIRNGQSLSALLGYRFERGLHDQEDMFLDSVILEFRMNFSLAGNNLDTTKPNDPDVGIEALEARNVVDGLKLIEHVQGLPETQQVYPFELESTLPEITDSNQRAAVDAQVRNIMSINDAVADLAMAEGVFQVVQGNYDRAAGTLEAFSKGNFPPTPEVAQTPRSGSILTHRVGINLEGGLNPSDAANTTPRSKAEPAINKWLQDHLPLATDVYCEVEFYDHVSAALVTRPVTQADLGLLPIDLLYLLNMDGEQEMKALDETIVSFAIGAFTPRPDTGIEIKYRMKETGKISFFDLAPFLKDMRVLLLGSRPLRPTDIRLPNEALKSDETTSAINRQKIVIVKDLLDVELTNLGSLKSDLEGALLGNPDAPVPFEAKAIANIDVIISRYRQVADAILKFGLPSATFAFAYDWRQQQFGSLSQKLSAHINRWDNKLVEFDQQMLAYLALDPSTSDQDKFRFLQTAGRLLWTAAITPLPPDPDQLHTDLANILRAAFEAVLNNLKAMLAAAGDVSGLYTAIVGEAAEIALHDLEAMELEDNKRSIVAFAKEIIAKVDSLHHDVKERLDKAQGHLDNASSANAAKNIDELTDAAHQLLDDEFLVLPEFKLTEEQSNEWQNSWDQQRQLMHHLETDMAIDFPLDDWLYGAARVREKLHHLESATMLSNALTGKDLRLNALQFPFREYDSWLGLQIPAMRRSNLFGIEPAFAGGLDAGGPVLADLFDLFQLNGQALTSKAAVRVVLAGRNWTIIDSVAEYHIEDAGTELIVYKFVSVIDEDKILYTAHYHKDFDRSAALFCGVLIDEWTEVIPTTEETTGLTFHYDRPNTEPPQTLLLATPSDFTGHWDWQDLVDTLRETLDLAKIRAVEPQHVDTTPYSNFLPAILSEVATKPITTTLNFAFNNGIQFKMDE